jgi:hypothetical protein
LGGAEARLETKWEGFCKTHDTAEDLAPKWGCVLDEECDRGVDNLGGIGVGRVVGGWVGEDEVEPAGRRLSEAMDLMKDGGNLGCKEDEGAVEGRFITAEGAAGE